jgi:hypothetical protein
MLPRLCGLEASDVPFAKRVPAINSEPRHKPQRQPNMAAASEKECQNMATLQLPADNHFATITNPVHHIVERKIRCASQQNRYSMTDMVG